MKSATYTIADLDQLARSDAPAFRALPRAECVAAVRNYAQDRRHDIRKLHDTGESGSAILRRLTDLCDEIVRLVAIFAGAHAVNVRRTMQQTAICALGGYGRREMSPHSDLDISLVVDDTLTADIETLSAFLLPFFWDIGFKAGYAIHTVRDAMELAASDPQIYTAYAQARLVFGDNTTFGRLKLSLADLDAANRAVVLDYVRQREQPKQLPEAHRDLYALEPDVKENAGGLRDFHAGLWMIALTQGALSLDDLAAMEHITAVEHLDILDGLNFIWRVRNELHFHTDRMENRLTFPLQQHVARVFDYGDTPQARERFMQDYYSAACRVRRFLQIATRISEQPSMIHMFEVQNRERTPITVYQKHLCVNPADKQWFAENPSRLMEVVWECARRAVPLSHATAHWLSNSLHLVNTAFLTSDTVRGYFLAICKRPLHAGLALREAARCGLLAAYLPEFGAVQGIMRYQDFHSYPVDEHTLRALEALGNLTDRTVPMSDILRQALETIRDPHVLVMGILLHDLGKVAGEAHIEEGVRIAASIADRIGLEAYEKKQLTVLVERHQTMSDIAFYRDTDDWDVIESFSAMLGNDDMLRMLFLLTYADLSAVGPNVYNEWKGALLVKLFLRAERLLTGRSLDDIDSDALQPKRESIYALAPQFAKSDVDSYLNAVGERYLLGCFPDQIAVHIACLEEARTSGLATRCVDCPELGTSEFVVCTRDRHGLFSEIAGAFASQLVDVRNAALFTRTDGWVVDSFWVHNAVNGRPLTADEVAAVTQVLEAVILHGHNIREYVNTARRRLFALTHPSAPVRPSVQFDNNASRTDTVIDIVAGDRTGLLFDIAHTLSEMGVDFRAAHIMTDVGRARDAFYVCMNGRKIENKKLKEWVARRLHEAVTGAAHLETT